MPKSKTEDPALPPSTRPRAGSRRSSGNDKNSVPEGEAVATKVTAPEDAPSKPRLYLDAPHGDIPAEIRRKILYNMMTTREVDNRIEKKLYRQGKILGGVYTGRGQEAISVACMAPLIDGDLIIPSHRDMGAYIARGMSLYRIFAQYLGRKDGPARGKDGNMHMGDLRLGLVSFVSMLADSVPIATGAAMAFQRLGRNNVAMTLNGEGATSRGDWHEGINLASVQKAPTVFVINNNQVAYSTPIWEQYACETLAVRGLAYGIPGYCIDGNDADQVYLTMKECVDRARDGGGPSIIECITFRMTGHSAHDDPSQYMAKEKFEEWKKKDPIKRYQKRLLEEKVIDQDWIDSNVEEIKAAVDKAVEEAEKCPYPEPEEALTDVYYDPGRPVVNQ
jgi:TPP-dependent pyruvate/acetoin dehydrogenase alpha subunit